MIPIDYEYCAYNYRAFDLANHFSEWMYDYTKKEYPYYRRNRRFFPSKDRQVRYIHGADAVKFLHQWLRPAVSINTLTIMLAKNNFQNALHSVSSCGKCWLKYLLRSKATHADAQGITSLLA